MNKQPISHTKLLLGIAAVVLLSLWLGIPIVKKWQADKLVNQLCEKNGGTTIYEVIKLPAESHNDNWLTNLPNSKYAKPSDYYYYDVSKRDISGNSASAQPRDLVIWRSETKIVRAADKKVMAKLISYTRRGGDAASPMHPSHYRCPSGGFPENAFIRAQ